jgi:anti-sigma factor RsiW
MTPEFPPNNPRAELEARLTAFILGELPAHDAAALRQAMDEDVALAALFERLKTASQLVREAAASPIEQTKEPAAPLRLSEEGICSPEQARNIRAQAFGNRGGAGDDGDSRGVVVAIAGKVKVKSREN